MACNRDDKAILLWSHQESPPSSYVIIGNLHQEHPDLQNIPRTNLGKRKGNNYTDKSEKESAAAHVIAYKQRS